MLVNISLDAPIFGGFLWLLFMVDLVLPILPSRKLIYPTWRKAENHGLKNVLVVKDMSNPPKDVTSPAT